MSEKLGDKLVSEEKIKEGRQSVAPWSGMGYTSVAPWLGVPLIFIALAISGIMLDRSSSYSGYVYHSPPHKDFMEEDGLYLELVYSADGTFSCGDITKWKNDWMPKGYDAKLEMNSFDHTTHNFKTLGEAEAFLASSGCKGY